MFYLNLSFTSACPENMGTISHIFLEPTPKMTPSSTFFVLFLFPPRPPPFSLFYSPNNLDVTLLHGPKPRCINGAHIQYIQYCRISELYCTFVYSMYRYMR